MTREELVGGLVRIGEKEMTGEVEAEVDAYFAPDFRFHGPDGGKRLALAAGVEPIWRPGSKGLQRARLLVLRVRPAGITLRR